MKKIDDVQPVATVIGKFLDPTKQTLTCIDVELPLLTKLYTHPNPADVQELVEALRQLCSIVEIHQDATGNNFAWAELPDAFEALAKWEGK
jgi:hypothetical protein